MANIGPDGARRRNVGGRGATGGFLSGAGAVAAYGVLYPQLAIGLPSETNLTRIVIRSAYLALVNAAPHGGLLCKGGAMKVEKRLRALEARFGSDVVILHLADGTERELRGPRNFLLDLIGAACRGADISASQAAQLEAVRQSLWAAEPGGGRLTEVIRILA